jgi:Phage integrase family
VDRPLPAEPEKEVAVTLVGRADNLGSEIVNFGLPLPPGFLRDASLVRIYGARGMQIEAAVRSLEPWRIDGKEGAIRSIQIQFQADSRRAKTQQVKVVFGKARGKNARRFAPVVETLIELEGLKGPRVLAIVPAKWLCDSWVVGPQVPAGGSGPYSFYDRFVEKSFAGSLQYIDSPVFDHWLFDRTTSWYKMYVRSGDRKFIEAAYQAAHFVRTHTRMEDPDAGMFVPKGSADLKYVYPRAMHIHYLLTGEERALETGKIMAKLILNKWDPVCNRGFWTPRHEGYGLLGVVHGWEPADTKTGKGRYLPIYGDMGEWLTKQKAVRDAEFPSALGFSFGTPPTACWHGGVRTKPGSRVEKFDASWKAAVKRAGNEGLLFHDLRRSAQRNMRKAGIDQSIRMKISGHKTDSMERRYNIVDIEDVKSAAKQMAKWIKGEKAKKEKGKT